jgi:hypothetical protein
MIVRQNLEEILISQFSSLFLTPFSQHQTLSTAPLESKMSQIFLAFGSSDQFFMKHAKGWDSSTQQQSSQQEMTQKLKAEGVDTYCFAFGEGSWFAAFTEASGKSAWKGTFVHVVPATLSNFFTFLKQG